MRWNRVSSKNQPSDIISWDARVSKFPWTMIFDCLDQTFFQQGIVVPSEFSKLIDTEYEQELKNYLSLLTTANNNCDNFSNKLYRSSDIFTKVIRKCGYEFSFINNARHIEAICTHRMSIELKFSIWFLVKKDQDGKFACWERYDAYLRPISWNHWIHWWIKIVYFR